LRRSRPRALRILWQQLIGPLRDGRTTLLVCLGDQAPLLGRARVLLAVNDLRRLTLRERGGALERAWYRFVVPRAVRRAATVVTISEFSRTEIERRLHPAARVRLVVQSPPPVVAGPRPGDAGGPFLVVGALRRYKGAGTVLDALARVPGATVVIAGPDEGYRPDIAAVANRVRLTGWIPDAELERLYTAALATIHPSRYEGYGLALAESLAHALPTLASDIPAHREVGGDAVLYFPSGDAGALAERMRELADNAELRADLSARALARSHELQQAGISWREAILAAASA
jgi:glycosyltransferase involved in cell wall biosynthesis